MKSSTSSAAAADREVGNQREIRSPHHRAIHRYIFGKGRVGEHSYLVSVVIEAALECSRSQAYSCAISDAAALKGIKRSCHSDGHHLPLTVPDLVISIRVNFSGSRLRCQKREPSQRRPHHFRSVRAADVLNLQCFEKIGRKACRTAASTERRMAGPCHRDKRAPRKQRGHFAHLL